MFQKTDKQFYTKQLKTGNKNILGLIYFELTPKNTFTFPLIGFPLALLKTTNCPV